MFNKSDFEWAEKHRELISSSCKLYLQPEWDKAAEMTPLIIEDEVECVDIDSEWDWVIAEMALNHRRKN